MDLKASWKI